MQDSADSLFSLEFFVRYAEFGISVPANSLPLGIGFRLLDFATIVIHAQEQTVESNVVDFSRGKSCVFRLSEQALSDLLTKVPLYVMLLELRDSHKAQLLGTSAVSLSCFMEPYIPTKEGLNGFRKGLFTFYDLMGNKIAKSEIILRLSSLGNALIPHLENMLLHNNSNNPAHLPTQNASKHVSFFDVKPPPLTTLTAAAPFTPSVSSSSHVSPKPKQAWPASQSEQQPSESVTKSDVYAQTNGPLLDGMTSETDKPPLLFYGNFADDSSLPNNHRQSHSEIDRLSVAPSMNLNSFEIASSGSTAARKDNTTEDTIDEAELALDMAQRERLKKIHLLGERYMSNFGSLTKHADSIGKISPVRSSSPTGNVRSSSPTGNVRSSSPTGNVRSSSPTVRSPKLNHTRKPSSSLSNRTKSPDNQKASLTRLKGKLRLGHNKTRPLSKKFTSTNFNPTPVARLDTSLKTSIPTKLLKNSSRSPSPAKRSARKSVMSDSFSNAPDKHSTQLHVDNSNIINSLSQMQNTQLHTFQSPLVQQFVNEVSHLRVSDLEFQLAAQRKQQDLDRQWAECVANVVQPSVASPSRRIRQNQLLLHSSSTGYQPISHNPSHDSFSCSPSHSFSRRISSSSSHSRSPSHSQCRHVHRARSYSHCSCKDCPQHVNSSAKSPRTKPRSNSPSNISPRSNSPRNNSISQMSHHTETYLDHIKEYSDHTEEYSDLSSPTSGKHLSSHKERHSGISIPMEPRIFVTDKKKPLSAITNTSEKPQQSSAVRPKTVSKKKSKPKQSSVTKKPINTADQNMDKQTTIKAKGKDADKELKEMEERKLELQKEAEAERQKEAERQREAEAERQREAEAERQREAEAERQREADAERQAAIRQYNEKQAELKKLYEEQQAQKERAGTENIGESSVIYDDIPEEIEPVHVIKPPVIAEIAEEIDYESEDIYSDDFEEDI